MFTAVSTIIAVLALSFVLALCAWGPLLSEAAAARKREETQRELERPDHDHEHALKIAETKSELSRSKGVAGTGA